MLKQLKIPVTDQVRVPHDSLRRTVAAFFEYMGETPEGARVAANTLVVADLRGVESHGVSNMMPYYLQYYTDGRINSNSNWRIVRDHKAVATIDADKGLGILLGPMAMDMAIRKAKDTGVGVVTLFNAGHSGAIGVHAMMALEHDMVGMVHTAGGARVVPTFAADAMLGTNPIALAAPARNEPPFVFDAATCVVAHNKIRHAQRIKARIPAGWIADENGEPIMVESDPPDHDFPKILPVGSTREAGSHKGYGLAMINYILASVLSGGLPSFVHKTNDNEHYFAAYDIAAFTDVDRFKDNMDLTLRTLREARPAPGHDRVLYAGLLDFEEEQDRLANGIPLHREVVEWLDGISERFGLPKVDRGA